VLRPLLLAFALVTVSFAQPDTAWLFRCPGAGRGLHKPLASFVDDTGNIYVSGWTGGWEDPSGAFLLKVDSLGRLVWARTYDSVEAVGVVRDTSGNIYIAGGQSGGRVCLLKYRPDGGMDWLATYGGASQYSLALNGIAVDDSQNVCVGAVSWSAANDVVHFRKYRPSGASGGEMSCALRHRLTMLDDRFHVLDNGDVFLVANSEDSLSGEYDWLTAKLSSGGQVLWERTYGESVDRYERQRWSQIDKRGNIYITGGVVSDLYGSWVFRTVKMDSSGKILWTSEYLGPDSLRGRPRFLLVSGGNVYVAGWNMCNKVGQATAIAVVKYDSLGRELWARQYGGGDTVSIPGFADENDEPPPGLNFCSMSVDDSANVYLTGTGYVNGDFFAVLLKYDAYGRLVWEKRRRHEGNEIWHPALVALDGRGALYDTGFDGANGSPYILKYRTR
jgi:hypothetical protein